MGATPSREEVSGEVASMKAVAFKLKESMDNAKDILGDPPLDSFYDIYQAAQVLYGHWMLENEKNPLFQGTLRDVQLSSSRCPYAAAHVLSEPACIVDEVATMNVEPLSKMTASDLKANLPLALAAYIADDDELEAELDKAGLKLLYHDPRSVAGKRTAHYVACAPAKLGTQCLLLLESGASCHRLRVAYRQRQNEESRYRRPRHVQYG